MHRTSPEIPDTPPTSPLAACQNIGKNPLAMDIVVHSLTLHAPLHLCGARLIGADQKCAKGNVEQGRNAELLDTEAAATGVRVRSSPDGRTKKA